ncbi:MAG: redoxin family protein [Bacteroidales bacterium]|jgi:thiol-disulfide isomerase/thioredoxin|nr:redoxin family protein [Bacteroidales bacterium]
MKKNILLFLLFAAPFITIDAQVNVVINVLDKTKGETNLSFSDYSAIRIDGFAETKKNGKVEITSDSTCIFVIEALDQQNLVYAGLFRERDGKQILMTPGDTVSAVIDFRENKKDRFEVVFYGKNEENYNAYYDLNKEFDRDPIMRISRTAESLEKYIQIIDSAYTSNTKRINATLKPSVLKTLMLEEEKTHLFQYLYYYKYYKEQSSSEKFVISDFLSIKNRYFPNEIVCENSLYLKSSPYSFGMSCLSSLLCEGITVGNQLMAETDTIEKYFVGELKDFLLARNYGSAVNRYKKNKELNDADMDNWYHDYFEKIADGISKKYIQYSYEQYKILGNPFPESILKEKIIQLSDSSVYTIGSFFEKYKGMQLVVDHWATWCGPCLYEMEIGKENVQKLKDVGNTFVYISFDKISDFNKAKEKATEVGIIENAYLILGNFNTEYANHLNMSDIPRYVMIDANGNIKEMRMHHPSSISNFSIYKKQ